MAHIDYYFTLLSPFTYLAGQRLEGIAAKHGASVTYKPFNLGEVGKETGFVPLAERAPARRAYRMQDLARIADMTGLPINREPAHWPMNPVPGTVAVIAAQKVGGGDLGLLVHALLRSTWTNEKDIADGAVVRDCLKEAGFDPALADHDMLGAIDTFERFTRDAIDAGVFGSPSYVVRDQLFWGQDRLDHLDRHLGQL
ncbi:2-hydroxychromene-2-carboxylate isomerase [Oceanibium sediminis]|uniref:2-hydroxychromene-2-carboxylate isomerase n=1 Tax=Oceanibium sediminis TaxID=2026339 RepID=UPI000DD3AEAB|nr:2-hydroxychromene-2-carboxylate isomerase [Oceanibium sediminis]